MINHEGMEDTKKERSICARRPSRASCASYLCGSTFPKLASGFPEALDDGRAGTPSAGKPILPLPEALALPSFHDLLS
jgi:hypothetical protein